MPEYRTELEQIRDRLEKAEHLDRVFSRPDDHTPTMGDWYSRDVAFLLRELDIALAERDQWKGTVETLTRAMEAKATS
jgi:hypothetical protein